MSKKMKFRKLDTWGATADAHAWAMLGGDLKKRTVAAVGESWTMDIQFGNVLSQLNTLGHSNLAQEIVDSIEVLNREQDENKERHERKQLLLRQGYDEDAIDEMME